MGVWVIYLRVRRTLNGTLINRRYGVRKHHLGVDILLRYLLGDNHNAV
jgi:hypothetical protein